MTLRNPWPANVLLILTLLGSACRTIPASSTQHLDGTGGWISEMLYLGASIPGGGEVSTEDWRAFIDEVVTPAFPDGFTSFDATGQWKGADDQIVSERTHVLHIVHQESATSETRLQRVIDEYKRRFRQEAVLRVRARVFVDFE